MLADVSTALEQIAYQTDRLRAMVRPGTDAYYQARAIEASLGALRNRIIDGKALGEND